MPESQPAARRAYDALREGIARGRWPGGAWLPEPEVCQTLGMSRTPVREAMRQLVSEGMLTHVPNRGVQVVALTANDVIDVTAVRAMVESYAASVAATRILATELEPLMDAAERQVAEAMADQPDLDAIEDCNSRVHDGIIGAARSSYLETLLESLRCRPTTRRTFAHYTRAELQRSARQHLDVLAALENRDSDWARASMSNHLLTARSSLLRALDAETSAMVSATPVGGGAS